jgi:DNA helicase-2/ATP-dependent DNA helicase PcrA
VIPIVIQPATWPPNDRVGAGRLAGVDAMLAALDPEQRAAATLPDGPAQIIAPAGSGKTTTMIARLGVLLARGVPAERIAVVTFNREAADELRVRIARKLAPHMPGASAIEVRTLHAMARQIVLDGRRKLDIVADRLPLLRAARRRCLVGRLPDAPQIPDAATLDTLLSGWKVERRTPPPEAMPVLEAYQALLAARHAVDFDDLVVGAADRLESDTRLRLAWQRRFTHVCVDEFQDVDAAQLRLVRILASPEDNLFVVGDDDQTIYAWRLADVRRILDFSVAFPSARRVLLATNYRCPSGVVTASAALIATNRERFTKRIAAGKDEGGPAPGSRPAGHSIIGFPLVGTDWPERLVTLASERAVKGQRCCILARTRAELGPIALALVRAGIRHAMTVRGPLDSHAVTALVDDLRRLPEDTPPFSGLLRARGARGWRRQDQDDAIGDEEHAALDSLVGWAAGFRTAATFLAAMDEMRARLEELRDPQAPIELITVHAAKGREWETVVILGFEEERFPNRRALVEAVDPGRAVEEERRLAYVAVTRATRQLVLAFDPDRRSRFLAEMGLANANR